MSIVLGYDESTGARRALDSAIELAQRYGEPLVVVYAVGPPGGVGEEFRAHQRALTEVGRAATDRAVADAARAGVEASVELVEDKPAAALVLVAERSGARMIVVGTYGESPIRGAMLGSTPHKLLQLSRRPVLCIPAHQDEV